MNDTIEIMCPVCGRRQTVPRWMWGFSTSGQEIMPGWIQRGHPLTCSGGGGPCPADTEMVPVGEAGP